MYIYVNRTIYLYYFFLHDSRFSGSIKLFYFVFVYSYDKHKYVFNNKSFTAQNKLNKTKPVPLNSMENFLKLN